MCRTLFELAFVESPYVWRSKLALAHKRLAYGSRRASFTEIPKLFRDGHRTVPVLQESEGREVQGSWEIVQHLDDAYPDRPRLLTSEGRERARAVESMLVAHAFPAYFPLFVLDILAKLPESEAAYFRASRESRLGAPLEEVSAKREQKLPTARERLQPLRDAFGGRPWLHGDQPGYGDHILLSFFVWICSVATLPPLDHADPLLDWIHRCQELHEGIAQLTHGAA